MIVPERKVISISYFKCYLKVLKGVLKPDLLLKGRDNIHLLLFIKCRKIRCMLSLTLYEEIYVDEMVFGSKNFICGTCLSVQMSMVLLRGARSCLK